MRIEGRTTAMTLESAIEIVVDDPVLASFPYWQQMAEIGVSPHITLLYPWRPAPVDDASINALRGVVRRFEPFSLTLSQVATFPKGVVYVVVEPVPLLGSLMAALAGAFPDTEPYRGEFADTGPVAHLTLATCEPDDLDTVRSEYAHALTNILPVCVRVTAVRVGEQTGTGSWVLTRVVPLGGES
jgi:2'-5' RNA ligase